jgi:hypothetical protein
MTDATGRRKMPLGVKVLTGCGVGCVVVMLLGLVAGFVGFRIAKAKLDETVAELREKGFDREVKGQALEVREEITEPTLYLGQVVRVHKDCHADLAIVAQMAEVFGKVEGKMYFRGQVLIIQPGAELQNGLDVFAQVVQNHGRIEGGVTGTYQAMQGAPLVPAPPAETAVPAPDASEEQGAASGE